MICGERRNRIQEFSDEVAGWVRKVRPSVLVYIVALIYIFRFRDSTDPRSRSRCSSTYIFGTALLIAYKYLDLYARGQLASQTHEEWAEMLSPDLVGSQLIAMECEFIATIGEKLEITTEFVEMFLELGYLNDGIRVCGIVPDSLQVQLSEVSESGQSFEDAGVPVFLPGELIVPYENH
jgi:hypothetical protein